MAIINSEVIRVTPFIRDIIQTIKFTVIKYNTLSSKNTILQNFSGIYTAESIIKEILVNYKFKSEYVFKHDSNTIYVHFYHKGDITIMDSLDILLLAIKGLYFIKSSNKKNISVTVNYCPVEFKKEFTGPIFGPNNVNSGFTQFYMNRPNFISIYRKEESHKVFIHEMVHYLHLDFVHINCSEIHNNIEKDFSIISPKSNINLFEAYTDGIAIIYNCIFNAILLGDDIYDILDYEIKYQYTLINSILNTIGSSHILTKLNRSGIRLQQKSNVLAYYFIKYGAMVDYNNLMKKYPLTVKWTKYKIREFYMYAKKNLYELDRKTNIKWDKTMRMSKNSIVFNIF
tara:strand:+ start:2082 stop:3107 length:1026 start_codon:yes stop_codon:yes gene_type:complete